MENTKKELREKLWKIRWKIIRVSNFIPWIKRLC